jgi:WD40 repeat protein
VFSPDSSCVATACFDRTVTLWETSSLKLRQTLRGHTGLVSGLGFSRDGRRIFSSGGEDKTIKVWDPQTGEEILNLRGHTLFCHDMTISPDGARLASAGKDGTIRIWDSTVPSGGEGFQCVTREHAHEVWSVEFSPDGRYLASASWGERSVRVWDPAEVTLLQTSTLSPVVMNLFHLSFSPDGTRIATAAASRDREAVVNVRETATGRDVFEEIRERGSVPFYVTFDPSGLYLVREGPDHTVQVHDAATGNIVGVVGHHLRQIWGMAFSPDEKRLATASNDGTVRVWAWDPARLGPEQKPQLELDARVDGYGNRVAFSSDGHFLATGGEGSSVKIWDAQSGALLHTLLGHSGDVFAIAFSRDSRWLATAGEDTTVRIWSATSWKLQHTLRGHLGLVMSLGFSPDSKRLASGSRDHTMKVWNTAPWDDDPNR